MNNRSIACLIAASFVGVGLVGAATQAGAAPTDVVVKGKSIDPETQRSVYYGDLNLAVRPDQRTLNRRIWGTASSLCFDLNGVDAIGVCTRDAVHSADDQVAAAIDRARLRMAGKPVGPAIAISIVIGAR
jgi:UrcA family protein